MVGCQGGGSELSVLIVNDLMNVKKILIYHIALVALVAQNLTWVEISLIAFWGSEVDTSKRRITWP